MSLAPGRHLGMYEVLGPLGAGGMGEVYRATDGALNRQVAIKVLPPAFARDEDRLARFTREAQTLAALNHPNIAHIHGLIEVDGIRLGRRQAIALRGSSHQLTDRSSGLPCST